MPMPRRDDHGDSTVESGAMQTRFPEEFREDKRHFFKIMTNVSAKRLEDVTKRLVTLDVLPGDVLVEILARVVSSSPVVLSVLDLANIKLTCKMLCEAARDRRVLRQATIVDGSERLEWWLYSLGSWPFLFDCAEAGNQLAACILGMVECYGNGRKENGKLHLVAQLQRKAASKPCIFLEFCFYQNKGHQQRQA